MDETKDDGTGQGEGGQQEELAEAKVSHASFSREQRGPRQKDRKTRKRAKKLVGASKSYASIKQD